VEGTPADLPEHFLIDSLRLAENYAFRGRHDEAFDVLSKKFASFASHPLAAVYLWRFRQELRLAPFLKPLHADPRWSAFMAEPA
jgi:hypothetical protein